MKFVSKCVVLDTLLYSTITHFGPKVDLGPFGNELFICTYLHTLPCTHLYYEFRNTCVNIEAHMLLLLLIMSLFCLVSVSVCLLCTFSINAYIPQKMLLVASGMYKISLINALLASFSYTSCVRKNYTIWY